MLPEAGGYALRAVSGVTQYMLPSDRDSQSSIFGADIAIPVG